MLRDLVLACAGRYQGYTPSKPMTAQTTARKQRGRPFRPGVSGNVAGRPKGSRNRATIMAKALCDSDAVDIVRAITAKAKRGDMVAARLVLDRLWPAPKGCTVTFPALAATDASGVVQAQAALLRCVAAGELTPDEAQAVSSMLSTQLRAIETADIDRRLAELEMRIIKK